ncbi:CU044_2847 family protein [Streptomonospora arabica]|uniref:CU044_2847 family protein n=1 Tax=Streptomonospora arabica TaxID=412417 RepID=A0ABV9ST75_9ACTN
MSDIVRLTVDGDDVIGIATVDPDGIVRSSGVPALLDRIRVEDIADKVAAVCRRITDRLNAGPMLPAETTVEFGVSVSSEAGTFIASAAGQGSVKVMMTWRPREGVE